jgi:hypothetical protein
MVILLGPLLDSYFGGHSAALFLRQINWNVSQADSRQSAFKGCFTKDDPRAGSIWQAGIWQGDRLQEIVLCQPVCGETQVRGWEALKLKLRLSWVVDKLENVLLHA